MPALPTTNLTLHVDASDTDNLFTTAGNPSSGTPTDGSAVQAVDDDDGKDLSLKFGEASSEANWRSTTPLMARPCLDFSGTDWYQLFNNAGTVGPHNGDTVVSTTAYVILASIYVENVTTNDATIYNNEALFSVTNDIFGFFFKNNAGAVTGTLYNWDGNEDTVVVSLNLNTSYVLVVWHTGGSIFVELYDTGGLAASGNTASGDTTSFGQFRVGRARDAISQMYQGRIGEMAFYNAHNSTDRANATQYFRDNWLPRRFLLVR